jgi:hypothetical protein
MHDSNVERQPTKRSKRNRNLRSETCLGTDSSELMRKYEPSPAELDPEPTNESVPESPALSAEAFSAEAEAVRRIHDTLLNVGRTMLEQMVRAGEILTRVKAGLPHGEWMPWAAKNLPNIHHRTLDRYMLVYRWREDPLMQSDPARLLDEVHGNIDPEEEQQNSTSTSNLPPENAASPPPAKRTRKGADRKPGEKSESGGFDSSEEKEDEASQDDKSEETPLSERLRVIAYRLEITVEELAPFETKLPAALSESVRTGMATSLGQKGALLRQIARELRGYAEVCQEGEASSPSDIHPQPSTK